VLRELLTEGADGCSLKNPSSPTLLPRSGAKGENIWGEGGEWTQPIVIGSNRSELVVRLSKCGFDHGGN
jgi:hypothetical protein